MLLRFLGADEANLGELNASKLAWMVDTPIMEKMLEQVPPPTHTPTTNFPS